MLIQKLESKISLLLRGSILALLAAVFVLVPDLAMAAPTEFESKMCDLLTAVLGKPAKVIATLAIVFLGIGAFFGKLNWGTALLFATGIIAIFAAAKIVTFLDSAGTADCGI